MSYDSKHDTIDHINRVIDLTDDVCDRIQNMATVHDASKLVSPEKEIFDEYTPKLRGLTYGTDEYFVQLKAMGPALQHHYENNPHHPESHENGITDMNLLEIIEMLADWKAATERHNDGDLGRSLRINRDRFMISEQLYQILLNTAGAMEWL